jgi:hypothetical protein
MDDDDDDDVNISRICESIRKNINVSLAESLCYELKQHEPLFAEECSEFLNQREQAKLE